MGVSNKSPGRLRIFEVTMTPFFSLSHSLKKMQKKHYNEIWVKLLETLRADEIFDDFLRELKNNCATLVDNGS